jgi:hypothetical protein
MWSRWTVDPLEDLLGGPVQTKGWERSFQPSMKAWTLVLRSRTDLNELWRMAWRSTMPNQTSAVTGARTKRAAMSRISWALPRFRELLGVSWQRGDPGREPPQSPEPVARLTAGRIRGARRRRGMG